MKAEIGSIILPDKASLSGQNNGLFTLTLKDLTHNQVQNICEIFINWIQEKGGKGNEN